MFRKVLDNFDIDTSGWWKEFDTTDENLPMGEVVHSLTKPAADIWSLWVKRNTAFQFVPPMETRTHSLIYKSQGILNIFDEIASFRRRGSNPFKHTKNPNQTPSDEEIIRNCLIMADHGRPVYSLSMYLGEVADRVSEYTDLTKVDEVPAPSVIIPNHLISQDTVNKINDNYLLTDAITGVGLEAACASHLILPQMGSAGLRTLVDLESKLTPDPNQTVQPPQSDMLHADCTLDIWWALQVGNVRSHILSKWPGWSDIFTAQDEVTLPGAEAMQTLISTKSKLRSELRRFCMAVSWNLNPNRERLKFPASMRKAYDFAVSYWPSVMALPEANGARLAGISKFVTQLFDHLDSNEERPKRETDRSGSDRTSLHGNHYRTGRRVRGDEARTSVVAVEQRSLDGRNGGSESTNHTVPGAIVPPIDWSSALARLDSGNEHHKFHASLLRQHRDSSRRFHDKFRKEIADEISASAWFVPNPPPLEHGNLDGVLDEGNLLRYAAFSDPNIFSVSPESGAGQIALGVLIDASASMNSHVSYKNFSTTSMIAACGFVGGLRDGLARNPNVHMHAFTFSGIPYSTPNMEPINALSSTNIVNKDRAICLMRTLQNDDDLLFSEPEGSTPTSIAISTLNNHLAELYPDAQRVILILTDGEPGAHVQDPFQQPDSSRGFGDNNTEVRKVVSSIDTPVFCVGINCDDSNLSEQYNTGHWFSVDSPMGAVKVAADLVRGIGQSLNC